MKESPSPEALNRLLARCFGETHPPRRLALALKQSYCNASIKDEKTGRLVGFVRITSDKGLNANLWDLAVEPGNYQKQLIAVLVNKSLGIIRKELPGCSVSLAAPAIAFEALQSQGFLLDPNGIRAMTYQFR
ncbi:N-acetyltransferase [Prochlorococcus marinus]|uniref:N-acetyltransferase n=1 Tax=Prochlorococcus marinus TaxID=1219 RepID=UPI001CED5277|nr:N-acetyltransferase [Prochlorococcus marinus]